MKTFFTDNANFKINISIEFLKVLCIFFGFKVFTVISCFSQQYVSPKISPNFSLHAKNSKVVTFSNELDKSLKAPIYYFDGFQWNNIQSDSAPKIKFQEPNVYISEFSESVFIPFENNLWEYANGEWFKHAVYDDYNNMRKFENVIELKDSSFLVSVDINYGYYEDNIFKTFVQRELFTFKKGQFTFPTLNRVITGPSQNYSQLKVYPNGNFSYFTNLYSGKDSTYEYVLFDDKENVLAQFSIPQIDEQFKNAKVTLTDYLFDSKGSIWFLTSSKREFLLDSNGNNVLDTSGFVVFTHNFPGLIEINSNKEIKYYNANIGIDTSLYESLSFDIDKNDNIWFLYNNRFSFPDNYFLPTMYKLLPDRKSVQKYSYETILKNSKIYNGSNANEPLEFSYLHKKLQVNNYTGSIYILTSRPLIEFFPEWIPASVSEISITPIHLYPNPVQSHNTISIESTAFEKVNNPLSIIIRDISGATIREETLSSNGNKLLISSQDLVSGTYFISVLSKNKTILQTKFIKE